MHPEIAPKGNVTNFSWMRSWRC